MWRGKKIQPITYTADFQYTEVQFFRDQIIVEDVKGGKATQTELFKVKVKMFKKLYPELIFRVEE